MSKILAVSSVRRWSAVPPLHGFIVLIQQLLGHSMVHQLHTAAAGYSREHV
jgi:hypothetical protein